MNKIKLLYLTPHLSTGGMPQFVLKRIESLQQYKDQIEIFLVEYSQFSDTYVTQRNKIIELLDVGHFWALGGTDEVYKKYQLIDIIKQNNIDIVHCEEIPEAFESFNRIPFDLLNQLYDNNRTWKIVETCHNVWYDGNKKKKLHPDYYSLVTPYHQISQFNNTPSPKKLMIFPFENKTKDISNKVKIKQELNFDTSKIHILNVGLWTEGKNQKEGIEVARLLEDSNPNLHFHFIGNQAPNFESYWKPLMENLPKNVTVWGERNDVDSFMIASDVLMFNSTWECNPLVIRESINYGLKILARNLPQYVGMFNEFIYEISSNDYTKIKDSLLTLINNESTYEIPNNNNFSEELLNFYKEVYNSKKMHNEPILNDYTFSQHFVVNPFFEITGQSDKIFDIRFYDENDFLIYNNKLPINHWIKLNREYFTKWKTEVYEDDKLIYSNVLNLKDQRVYISFGSKSLGDTLAWIPYCEEFRKKHDCKLIVSTFMNSLFKDQYPNIEFVEPGDVVNNVVAQYRLGWFYNEDGLVNYNSHPLDFRRQSLQKTATDILGLEYKEIRPKLKLPNVSKKKKVGIGFHSTAQAKYWNNPDGWQSVIDHLDALGYECMIYSKEGDGYMNNFYPNGVTLFKGGNLQEVIDDLSTCEFFIGLGSGLSWLAWACKLPVILISGFSEKFAETKLDTYRVINENVCHGCFNNDRLNAGDWNWCPHHKGTDRQFECSKKITSDMVIKEINKIINKEKSFDWGTQNDWYIKTINEEIFENKIYERFFEVEKGDIVLDIGASLGPFTFSILNKNPKHVFCFEPCEEEFPTLVKNTIGHPVTHIMKGISNTNNLTQNNKLFNSVDGLQTEMESITFKKFIDLYGIEKIDFLKTDCEGGEYDIFNDENYDFIKNNVKKISGEWHLNESYYKGSKEKFRKFRDTYLKNMNNHQVFSVDGVNIKWDLWNEHFIEYYDEVIIYIDNRQF
jgi:autotransporter strand-loop-strand O-heptosyltransferase